MQRSSGFVELLRQANRFVWVAEALGVLLIWALIVGAMVLGFIKSAYVVD